MRIFTVVCDTTGSSFEADGYSPTYYYFPPIGGRSETQQF